MLIFMQWKTTLAVCLEPLIWDNNGVKSWWELRFLQLYFVEIVPRRFQTVIISIVQKYLGR